MPARSLNQKASELGRAASNVAYYGKQIEIQVGNGADPEQLLATLRSLRLELGKVTRILEEIV